MRAKKAKKRLSEAEKYELTMQKLWEPGWGEALKAVIKKANEDKKVG